MVYTPICFFRALTREWGIPLLDLFAMRWNHKLPLTVSPIPDPSAMAVHPADAVFNELEDTVDIHIPPPTLLPLVLE